MRVLLIGSGGREHALAWAISASPLVDGLFCAPGNAGIADVATCVDLNGDDHAAVIAFCKSRAIDLVVVGPEAPLVAGLTDALRAATDLPRLKVFGPSRAAAQLEGSKGFTKDLCRAAGIPTAAYARFCDADTARDYVENQPLPIVVKADGLAAGKGVVIAETRAAANAAINACFEGTFGGAGSEVVIEAFLEGEEASVFALVDGCNIRMLASAQDHKRVGDGDTGPNTGGMGAYSPAPAITKAMSTRIEQDIIRPTVAAMAARGTPFQGVLYAGLMMTDAGPQLIEYNVRFGDPECQVLMVRLKSDLVPALIATCEGTLDQIELSWHEGAALTVVAASRGYPGPVDKGSRIGGIDAVAAHDGVDVFHAATRRDADGTLTANGGRVLGITARGADVAEAQARAYRALDDLAWPDGFWRRDIGWRAIARNTHDR